MRRSPQSREWQSCARQLNGASASLCGLAVEVEVRGERAAGQLTLRGMTVDPHRLVPPTFAPAKTNTHMWWQARFPGTETSRPRLQCPPATTQRAILARLDTGTA